MSEWISVIERFPEENCAVLINCPEYKNIYCVFRQDGTWRVFGGTNRIWDSVTHWMPLPKPPEVPSE